jgi:ubiquinone/menaquinone biosynthesis C-methylase UbiE
MQAPATLDAVLAEARRVLKPGGRLVSADHDAGTRVIDHPDRETTRAIIGYDCDHLFADGWLGRRLPR